MKKLVLASIIFSFGVAQGATINIATKGGELAFDKTTLSAKAGESIKLTFKNTSPKDAGLQHNWVLVKPNTADQVAAGSISAGADKGWLSVTPDVLAHTKLVNSGESDTIAFKAPPAGDYPYFCSYPGHAQTMKGVLHVK